ncbi:MULTISPECIES: ribokinase [Staphylococcus]|uniref:Ribokinase n=1 Tax=Staphylococcus equorum TaxID=246432 RepID=A0AAP7LUH0_9STAP|nr:MULTISPECIES: ribokinase [Staphylococcus]ANK38733.1 ribokinase [Staphylococcus sp. AntiMn-1]ANR69261.1 ribokinase [Staphylococcus equorum]ERH35748.1 ribokinase [Staphylococcus equorum UMC-CNS-924]MCE5007859.1 ribokinase [Staphylococcus equorum]MCE5047121.1 ribokinase [Staphylococcus equorum]
MTNKVVIIGSTNVDKILNVDRFVKPGETLHLQNAQKIYGGGKGANQALATARSNAQTTFISKIGTEGDADFMLEDFEEAHMNTDYIMTTDTAQTGQAFITIDANGQNTILVYGGANMELNDTDVNKAADAIAEADYIIAQLEVPVPAIISAFKIARENNVTTILNPAPASELSKDLLTLTDIIVPNETEAELLSGIAVTDRASMHQNAEYFLSLGMKVVIITLGEQGTYYATANSAGLIPSFKVKAIDTTAAGDTFIGAFASRLNMTDFNIEESITYANKAASLTVQVEGAQKSIPLEQDVLKA